MQLPGKDTNIYRDIRGAGAIIHTGGTFSVDPSIGSMSSMPGWAYYFNSELVASGTVVIDPGAERWVRLKTLYEELHKLSSSLEIDTCVFEQVPVSAHGGRSQVGHASLLMACGVVQAAVAAEYFIGITPIVWKSRTSDDYVKGDEEDAVEMGRIVCRISQLMQVEDPKRRYGNRGKSK